MLVDILDNNFNNTITSVQNPIKGVSSKVFLVDNYKNNAYAMILYILIFISIQHE